MYFKISHSFRVKISCEKGNKMLSKLKRIFDIEKKIKDEIINIDDWTWLILNFLNR